jgi:nicotinamidase-related amidase
MPFDSDTALIVVDLQAVTLGNARTVEAPVLLARVAQLLAGFRAVGALVVHAVSTGTPAGRTSYGTGRSWTSEQTEIAGPVRPTDAEPVVRRSAWSAFAGTGLAELLRSRDIRTVVIVGLATPFGIESTARDAYDAGFSVLVPVDAVAGPDPAGHAWTLERVVPLLGRTTTTADVLAPDTTAEHTSRHAGEGSVRDRTIDGNDEMRGAS